MIDLDDGIIFGQCPVQGQAIVAGWLFYFRARSSWDLSCWPPGSWVDAGGHELSLDAVDLLAPPVVIDERNVDAEFPAADPELESYPGWWDHAYALRVFKWAAAKAIRGATT